MKLKDIVSGFLKSQGVEIVFGHTGAGNIDFIESLAKSGIKVMFSRNENNAAYLADGYSRAKNSISIVTSTTGCGATNLVTGLANAYSDEIPIVAICAMNNSNDFGLNNHQDGTGKSGSVDQNEILKNCCKHSIFVFNPKLILSSLKEAFRISQSERKGPVYLGIPKDFWNVDIDIVLDEKKYRSEEDLTFNNKKIMELYELIYKSEHPLILIGDGIRYGRVGIDFEKFINKMRIPFALSPLAKDFIDESNDYCLGSIRLRGSKHILKYLAKTDLIILLGNRLTELEFGNNKNLFLNKQIIQIDKDPNEIGRIISFDHAINSNGTDFFNYKKIRNHRNSTLLKSMAFSLKKEAFDIPQKEHSEVGMNPFYIPKVLEKYSSKEAVFVVDSGYTKSLFISKLNTKSGQRFIVADKFSPMGYSIPASIGVAISGKKEVYCLVGDGSFQMTFNELTDLIDVKIKIILILLKNNGMRSVKPISNLNGNLANFSNPDFLKISQSVGMEHQSVKNVLELVSALNIARKSTTSQFIEIDVDQSLMKWDFEEDNHKNRFGLGIIRQIGRKLRSKSFLKK